MEGRNPLGCLPYGERAEAPREFFTAGRQRDSAGEASDGPIAQLARAPIWHVGGRGFKSHWVHQEK